jgi:opacity protein-like surface antigen
MKKIILGIVSAMCVYSITQQSQAAESVSGPIMEASLWYGVSDSAMATDANQQIFQSQMNLKFL